MTRETSTILARLIEDEYIKDKKEKKNKIDKDILKRRRMLIICQLL
jgi:hypothetical protein